MAGLTLGFIIMLLAGALPCIVLGYFIAVKQQRGLISGWNESKISDPEAYAKWVGYSVLGLGVCIGIIAFIWYIGLIDEISMTVSLIVASLIPIPCLVIANQKYARRKHDS